MSMIVAKTLFVLQVSSEQCRFNFHHFHAFHLVKWPHWLHID